MGRCFPDERHPDLPFHEGVVRHSPPADDWVRREPAAAGWPQLDGARLQHPVPAPEDPGREQPVSRLQGAAAPADPLSGHCFAMPCRAVDSTGIKVEGEGEWHARKHGGPKRRVWRKIHLGIDEETLEVRAVEITGSHIGDAPVLPGATRCYPTCSARSRRTSGSAASLPTVPTTHVNVKTLLPTVAPMPSSRPARTRSLGRPSPPGRSPLSSDQWRTKARRETRPCAR